MQKKQGISLIVLVITIIVMIILAASVVITLSNTGVINRASQAVDLTNEAAVQDLAALTWADAYMNNKRGTELINEVTTKLGEQGVTADKWNISVTDTGVTVTSKNEAKPGTLGYLIDSAEDYGKYVDYSVVVKIPGWDYDNSKEIINEVEYKNWRVYYEDEKNGYVFLVSDDLVSGLGGYYGYKTNPWDDLQATVETLETPKNKFLDLYNIFKLGQEGYTLNKNYEGSLATAEVVTKYMTFANTTDYINKDGKSYVIGAIGTPTIELLAAGYNAKYPQKTRITPVLNNADGSKSEYGYYINEPGKTVLHLEIDDLYIVNDYFLASPTIEFGNYGYNGETTLYVGTLQNEENGNGISYLDLQWALNEGYDVLRPVVCIKSDIPAVATADGFSLVK